MEVKDMSITDLSDELSLRDERLYQKIQELIEQSKAQVVSQVNQALVLTYWGIGKVIKTTLVTEERAEYGDATVARLAKRLSQSYGNGFGRGNLFRMMRFYEQFPNEQIVPTLSAQLSWSHFVELIRLDDALKREFYVAMCTNERWSVRVLRDRMNGILFERMAIAQQVVAQIFQSGKNLLPKFPRSTIAFYCETLAKSQPNSNLPQVAAKIAFQSSLSSVKAIEAELGGYDG
jgi:DUF1016 N-terminal domain